MTYIFWQELDRSPLLARILERNEEIPAGLVTDSILPINKYIIDVAHQLYNSLCMYNNY